MSTYFRNHPLDTHELHKSTRKLGECNCYATDQYGEPDQWVAEVEVLTCDCLWRIFQKEAEHIVAPGGVLIADPQVRNRRINAAYAQMWLQDNRFEWAGLAAFASKQVGCGLLHAANIVGNVQRTEAELADMEHRAGPLKHGMPLPARAAYEGGKAGMNYVEDSAQFVHDMLALGNTALFLDIYPLHVFYKKRGLKEMKKCIQARVHIRGNPKFPIMWPVNDTVRFGTNFGEIIPAFEAIEAGNIQLSVKLLADHEQVNILQPTIYNNPRMRSELRKNQFAYVSGMSFGLAQPIELTLSNECSTQNEGRRVGFSNSPLADLADVNQRMPFVLRAAKQFHRLLNSPQRPSIEHAIREISQGRGIR